VLAACMVGEQVDTELEVVGVEPVAYMVAQLVGAMVALEVAMPVHVESRLERSAQLVGSAAVAADPVRVPCHTWELARESMSKKQFTNMSAQEATSTMFDQEEIALASSRAVVC